MGKSDKRSHSALHEQKTSAPKTKQKYSKEGRESFKQAFKHRFEKRAGSGANSIEVNARGRAAGEGSDSTERKGRGFRVGPKPAAGVYTGKADKIKANLIRNAKIKKDYAKVLKQEKASTSNSTGDGITIDEHNDDENGMSVEEDEQVQEHVVSPMKGDFSEKQASTSTESEMKPKRKKSTKSDSTRMREDILPPKPVLHKRKSGELERDPNEMLDDEDAAPREEPDASGSGQAARQPFVHPSRRGGNAAGADQQQAQEPPKKRARLTEAEIEAKRAERKHWKQAWSKKTKTGQPNMGSRMNVLLNKIQNK